MHRPVALLMLGILASSAEALPRFALLAGQSCNACHVTPTGGGMRNPFGLNLSREDLPMWTDDAFKFTTRLTPNIAIGADARGQFLAADSLFDFGTSKVIPGGGALQGMQMSLYAAVQIGKHVMLYAKNDFITQGGFEWWGMLSVLPNDGYVRAGVFMPALGLRVDDHTSFTRYGDVTQNGQAAGFGIYPNSKEAGIEVGEYVPLGGAGNLFVLASLSNGEWPSGNVGPTNAYPNFTHGKNVLGRIEYEIVPDSGDWGGMLGASGMTDGLNAPKSSRNLYGVFGGVRLSVVSVTADLEFAQRLAGMPSGATARALMLEAAIKTMPGLYAILKFDTFDPDLDAAAATGTPKTTWHRETFGLEFFPLAFVEVRPQVRLVNTKSDNTITTSSSTLREYLLQAHFWF